MQDFESSEHSRITSQDACEQQQFIEEKLLLQIMKMLEVIIIELLRIMIELVNQIMIECGLRQHLECLFHNSLPFIFGELAINYITSY